MQRCQVERNERPEPCLYVGNEEIEPVEPAFATFRRPDLIRFFHQYLDHIPGAASTPSIGLTVAYITMFPTIHLDQRCSVCPGFIRLVAAMSQAPVLQKPMADPKAISPPTILHQSVSHLTANQATNVMHWDRSQAHFDDGFGTNPQRGWVILRPPADPLSVAIPRSGPVLHQCLESARLDPIRFYRAFPIPGAPRPGTISRFRCFKNAINRGRKS
jgi:hypothetical protein